MSGVLLTVAFYAILRFKAVTDLAVGPAFARTLLVIVALLSLAVAASLLVTQRDYKRMLAYHSIEHMGLIALGAAAGHQARHRGGPPPHPRPRAGQERAVPLLGRDHGRRGHERDRRGERPVARRPALGGIFGVGLVALLGFPPFSLFTSELVMVRAEFEVGLGWAAVLAMVAMVTIFIAVVGHARHMLLGPPTNRPRPWTRPAGWPRR